ncbi:MAG: glycosyltransferase, partial [Cyanobacteria bacterium P01_F01_bin.3]
LVHIHAVFSFPSTIAMAIANFYRVPYIIRPLGSLCQWSLEQSKKQKAIYLRLIKRFLNNSSGLHLTAPQEQKEVSSLSLKCNDFVVPLGINESQDSSSDFIDIRQEFKIENSDPILLFLSRIHPKKGIEILIKALQDLQDTPFNLILAGSGDKEYERLIQQCIDESTLSQQIKSIGFVQGEVKQALLSQADLFVLTSHSENFGIVVLEAMAAGTPTLTTPGVALSNWIQHNNLGWVCSLDQASICQTIEHALSNPQLLKDKGRSAQKLAKAQYGWTAIAQQLAFQYQEALSQEPSTFVPNFLSKYKNA